MKTASRIALIDDDRAWRETLADYLSGKGFEVYPAENARRGLDVVDRNDIRLAVIDYHMGEMDGLALLRRLRSRARSVAAFMLSSENDPTLEARALAEGARAFLSKTATPAVLLRTLVQTLTTAAEEPPIWLPILVRHTIRTPGRDPKRN